MSLASSDALITAGWKRRSPRRNSDDNALGETVNGLYKATLIYSKRICEPASEIELATLNWVHWWNTSRLYEALGYRSPTAVEAACTPPPRRRRPRPSRHGTHPGRFKIEANRRWCEASRFNHYSARLLWRRELKATTTAVTIPNAADATAGWTA